MADQGELHPMGLAADEVGDMTTVGLVSTNEQKPWRANSLTLSDAADLQPTDDLTATPLATIDALDPDALPKVTR